MMEFQDNDTTILNSLEDLFLILFTMIDDLYARFAPPEVLGRRNCGKAGLSDSEVIAIAVCGELVGVDSEKAWHSFVKRNYRHLFPRMGDRSRFNRTRRNLLQVTEMLREKVMEVFCVPCSHFLIADSFPMPVCEFGRAHFCHAFRGHGADHGYCASKKETYFGFKCHALITLDGYITAFDVTPASVDDREGLRDLVDGISGITVLGDKGYAGAAVAEEMREKGIFLMALKRRDSRTPWPKEVCRTIFRLRRRVETVFSQLAGQLNAERVLATSVRGMHARLVCKVLAHNLCMALNRLFGKTVDICQIKELVF